MANARQEAIGIIGAGPAALITAHTLLKDGFENVQLLTEDKGPGGVWAKDKVYPGLSLNNVHGELRFSPMEMEAPKNAQGTGGRLTGEIMSNYMQAFAQKYIGDRIRYQTEVINVKRGDNEIGWAVTVEDLKTQKSEVLHFSKLVLCTGGNSRSNIPDCLGERSAEASRYRGLVVHSSKFREELPNILASVKPSTESFDGGKIVIVGCGKSAQDMAAYLANEGISVSVIYRELEPYLASPKPTPDHLRKSRAFSALSPYSSLRSGLEHFLHKTWLGSMVVRFMFNRLLGESFHTFHLPKDSPLRNVKSFLWDSRINDEGVYRSTSFYSLANHGKIKLYSPAHAVGYAQNENAILLDDGRKVSADVVILATGYRSSWEDIFDLDTANTLGIRRRTLSPSALDEDPWASYISLRNPPQDHLQGPNAKPPVATSIYKGIVPASNIQKRDFAINGAVLTGNNGYVFEVMAHWISSYFLGDRLRLPATPELALEESDRHSRWCEKRFPGIMGHLNESTSSAMHLWSWPQYSDELLEDMRLPSGRSGGSWYNWMFKIIDLKEIEKLTEERQQLRGMGLL